MSRRAPNLLYAWLQRRPSSRRKIPAIIESLGIDAAESERPAVEYWSLAQFFIRGLKPGVRPVDSDPAHIISPADGRALVYPCVADAALQVKQSRVSHEQVLGSADLAQRYSGGAAIVVRLAPADCHRFHFPDDGVASESRVIAGPLHSVHPIAPASGAPSFSNKRAITHLETRRGGNLALIEIGALCVGTIVQTYRPGPVIRGQEKGFFRFGGSTVVVLAEPARLQLAGDLIAASADDVETPVRMGARLGGCP